MTQWHRYMHPIAQPAHVRRMQSSVTLDDGTLTVTCGERNVLVGISGDEASVNVHLNGESHQYDRALVERVRVSGARGSDEIELLDRDFDLLVVAKGGYGPDPCSTSAESGDLHASRAARKRRAADDFGLV